VRWLGIAALVLVGVTTGGSHAAPDRPQIRVDELGFAPGEAKIAYLLAPRALPGASFSVVDRRGRTVLSGTAGTSRGSWNGAYGAVQPLDLSALRAAGTYRVRVGAVVSPPFRVARAASLFVPRVADVVAFFQAQRDGSHVIPGPLHRRPSHLNDRRLTVYDWPRYESPDSDVILGSSLKPLGGPVDLEGGWVDAGDFIKFTHTTAYAEVMLLATRRALGGKAPPGLAAEARYGLRWLEKAWDPVSAVLQLQVGIGSGNKAGTFHGDHDLWRSPERDDHLTGAKDRYLSSRPAFRANAPGRPVPPNLAGRVAASFALAAQLDRSRAELNAAARLFAAAKVRHVTAADVVTALPHAFYPESSWLDDMELAGAELALAGRLLHDPRATGWLRAAEGFARGYLAGGERDTLNLYDTSALAHADLIRAGSHLRPRLLADLRAQLRRGLARAAKDPFGAAARYDDFDAAPHTFGLAATAGLYRELTGDRRYDAFATQQRGWALGANAWGASLMIGVGSAFPRCPQHVVANLAGSLDGRPPLLRGAVVNGPNGKDIFAGGLGGYLPGMRRCPRAGDSSAVFTGHGSRYVDDVRAWQTVEPALDFSAVAALAFALSD